jgi:hypothetical protein
VRRLIDRLTYANVIATVALFVALGGGAYAALKVPKNSVGSAQIRNGKVKAPDLARGSVTPAKIRGGLAAGGNGPPGPAGPAGPTGRAGRDGAAHITTFRHTSTWPVTQVQNLNNPAFVPTVTGGSWTQPPGALDWFFGRFLVTASSQCQDPSEGISYQVRMGNTIIAEGEAIATGTSGQWQAIAFRPQYAWLAPPAQATQREITFYIGELCPQGAWTLNELRVDVIRAFG